MTLSVSDTRPQSLQNGIARDAGSLKPNMPSNHQMFEIAGNPFARPYEHDAEPVKLSCPDIMAGYYTIEDSQRMLDADMVRRRNRFKRLKAAIESLDNCPIPKEG